MHYEMEEEEHVVYPDDPDFDINKARLFTTVPRICVRYECVPMRFIKHVYKIHTIRKKVACLRKNTGFGLLEFQL